MAHLSVSSFPKAMEDVPMGGTTDSGLSGLALPVRELRYCLTRCELYHEEMRCQKWDE
jgi:hypothetical protein